MTYTKEFLISELHRFVRENGRVPKQLDMDIKNGYPSFGAYVYYFGSWNNALEAASLKINQYQDHWQDGTETCSYCGKRADEIPGFTRWYYNKNDNSKRHCNRCGNGNGIFDYKKGILDINSPKGRGRAGEITVIKALKIGDEHDCALISMGYSFDLYHDIYKKIDVKTSVLSYYNRWKFNFKAEKEADTYICLGMSSDTKHVERVWVVPNENEIRDLTGFTVYNTYGSLRNREKWEVSSKIYDNAWQEMLLNYTDGKCKVFGKKDETEEEKQKNLQFRKELIERLGLKGNYLLGN